MQTGENTILLMIPLGLRKNRAVTPWLVDGKTKIRMDKPRYKGIKHSNTVCVLEMSNTIKHVHSGGESPAHYAIFDMRC